MTPSEQSESIHEVGRYWRQDFGNGTYLYFARTDDDGLYVEIRNGSATLKAATTDAGAASILEWLDRSRS